MTTRLIDTHVHVWNFDRTEYSWLKNDTSILNRNYNIEELEEERLNVGVTEGILVQSANNFEDTDWMLEVAAKTDWINGVVGWVPLMDDEAVDQVLNEKYLLNEYFKGVRHLIHDEADANWLLQRGVIDSLKVLQRVGLPYDVVGILNEHIETAVEVAKKVPGLKMVFDHLNQPPISGKEKFGKWGSLMSEAAAYENFYVKISGLGTTSKNEGWAADHILPYIEFVLSKFGEDKCMCGGDWPVSLLGGSYTKTWSCYKAVLSKLLDKEGLEKVFYKNAQRFYNLK
jgi:L-fuconolactonase